MNPDKEYPEPPEKNPCGGYYCSEEHGHIDCQDERYRRALSHCAVCSPGLTMEGVTYEHVINPNSRNGQYYIAKAKIGTIFGSEVEGELQGVGTTKEMALARLQEERQKLYESLWV